MLWLIEEEPNRIYTFGTHPCGTQAPPGAQKPSAVILCQHRHVPLFIVKPMSTAGDFFFRLMQHIQRFQRIWSQLALKRHHRENAVCGAGASRV
jgi:hypothetical protein